MNTQAQWDKEALMFVGGMILGIILTLWIV